MTPAAAALALVIGAAMGVLGGGGSIIAVPAFTFFLHFAPKDAVVTSLAVVGFAAAAGAIRGWLRGIVPIGVTLTVGLSAAIGAYAGSFAGSRISDHLQLVILGNVMFIAAVALWSQPLLPIPRAAHESRPLLAAIGLTTGALTGLVGVGGGFLVVPALVIGAGLSMQQAAAASFFVIALAAGSGLVGYAANATLDWTFIIPFAAIAAAGTIAGARVACELPQRRLQQAFAVSLVIVGSFVCVRA